MIVQNNNLQLLMIKNQIAPDEGSKAVALILDFTVQDTYELDLSEYMQQARISQVQTLLLDCAVAVNALVITINGTGQRLIAKPQTQGYYNVLASNPLRMTFTCPAGPIMKLFLINVPIPGAVWATQ